MKRKGSTIKYSSFKADTKKRKFDKEKRKGYSIFLVTENIDILSNYVLIMNNFNEWNFLVITEF